MKYFFIVLSILFIISCNKDDSPVTDQNNTSNEELIPKVNTEEETEESNPSTELNSLKKWPDDTNTGSRIDIDKLEVIEGDVELTTPNEIFSQKLVKGSIRVSSDNITIRDVIVSGGVINIGPPGNRFGPENTLIEFVEIDGGGKGIGVNAKNKEAGKPHVVRRSNIYNVFDGLRTDQFGGKFTENYIHNWGNLETGNHADGIQVLADIKEGYQVILDRNNFFSPTDGSRPITTAAINSVADNWVVTNNRIVGSGYGVYFQAGFVEGDKGLNYIFTNNIIYGGEFGRLRSFEEGEKSVFENNTDQEAPFPLDVK